MSNMEEIPKRLIISLLLFLMPFFVFITGVQYIAYYLMTFFRWLSNVFTAFSNYLTPPWYLKKDKRGVYYSGPIILQIWSLTTHLYNDYTNE